MIAFTRVTYLLIQATALIIGGVFPAIAGHCFAFVLGCAVGWLLMLTRVPKGC